MSNDRPTDSFRGRAGQSLDDADPFAGDDEPWADEDGPFADPAEHEVLRFARGLLIGLLFSLALWAVIGALIVAAYKLVS